MCVCVCVEGDGGGVWAEPPPGNTYWLEELEHGHRFYPSVFSFASLIYIKYICAKKIDS